MQGAGQVQPQQQGICWAVDAVRGGPLSQNQQLVTLYHHNPAASTALMGFILGCCIQRSVQRHRILQHSRHLAAFEVPTLARQHKVDPILMVTCQG